MRMVQERQRPVEQFLLELITVGVKERASDIHLEPFQDGYLVRYRIDGLLRLMGLSLPLELGRRLVAAIKAMAEMDLAESRLPQDGRFSGTFEGVPLDLRVSTLPTPFGEKVVLRLLPKEAPIKELSQLGMDGETLRKWKGLIKSPQGMLLVVGPTGSGKTTTLYASLRALLSPSLNIVTVEDPFSETVFFCSFPCRTSSPSTSPSASHLLAPPISPPVSLPVERGNF